MDATLAVQLQIRQNAEEISSVLRELQGWEKAVQGKDKALRGQKKKAQLTASAAGGEGVRVSGGAVPLKTSSSTLPQQTTDVEEVERERGNAEFKAGRFEAAVRCYTKCLGLKARNCLAFSNRAMAFLKMREFSRALSDCNSALAIAPQHVKSLLRRASALAALGRLRAALRDLRQVLEAEPNNKQARADLLQVREQLRNAVARAPLVAVRSAEAILQGRQQKQEEVEGVLQGPDPLPPSSQIVKEEEEEEKESDFLPIAIVSEDEEEQEEETRWGSLDMREAVTSPPPPAAVTTAPLPVESEEVVVEEEEKEAEEVVIRLSANNNDSVMGMKRKKVVKKKQHEEEEERRGSRSRRRAEAISGAYELEKALLQAGDDVAAVERVVRVQAMPGIDRILRGAMEPEALLLLLRALLLLHRRHRLSASQTSHYLLRISRAPNFSFLRALLPRQQQEEVAEQVEVLLAEQEEEGSKALREAYRVV
eukprot:scaffold437_cov168-Ochromonas_danica.AAC.42